MFKLFLQRFVHFGGLGGGNFQLDGGGKAFENSFLNNFSDKHGSYGIDHHIDCFLTCLGVGILVNKVKYDCRDNQNADIC